MTMPSSADEPAKFLAESLRRLSATRSVFHSEADLQHELAWQMRVLDPQARIRLEIRPNPEIRESLDLLVTTAGRRIAIELKYLVRGLTVDVDGERFVLRDQGAQPLARYDVLKDVARLERFTASGWADLGFAVAISNDPSIWSPGNTGSIDEAFRMHDGAVLTGTLQWAPHAGPGTTKGRTQPITLTGSYQSLWSPFSSVGGTAAGTFRALVVMVIPPSPAGTDATPR